MSTGDVVVLSFTVTLIVTIGVLLVVAAYRFTRLDNTRQRGTYWDPKRGWMPYAPELMPRVRSAVFGGVDGYRRPDAAAVAAMVEEYRATLVEEQDWDAGAGAPRPPSSEQRNVRRVDISRRRARRSRDGEDA